jgi:hypothetical protein
MARRPTVPFPDEVTAAVIAMDAHRLVRELIHGPSPVATEGRTEGPHPRDLSHTDPPWSPRQPGSTAERGYSIGSSR